MNIGYNITEWIFAFSVLSERKNSWVTIIYIWDIQFTSFFPYMSEPIGNNENVTNIWQILEQQQQQQPILLP